MSSNLTVPPDIPTCHAIHSESDSHHGSKQQKTPYPATALPRQHVDE
ncbi:MAG: hypothetical protein Q7U78_09100 [Gallionella sp.]|nr:hypothetical protein [Gallionella sp.]